MNTLFADSPTLEVINLDMLPAGYLSEAATPAAPHSHTPSQTGASALHRGRNGAVARIPIQPIQQTSNEEEDFVRQATVENRAAVGRHMEGIAELRRRNGALNLLELGLFATGIAVGVAQNDAHIVTGIGFLAAAMATAGALLRLLS